jgi:transposase
MTGRWRKGQRYGSILVDLERHRPIDLLPDRESESFEKWLEAHSGVEITFRQRLCRRLTKRRPRMAIPRSPLDHSAVVAGLEQSWSNGQVEGQVHRLKLLKR